MGREVERLRGGMKNRICICLAAVVAQTVFGEVSLLGTCPAEDSSTGVRIVWHSDSPQCELRFGPEGGGKKPVAAEKVKALVEELKDEPPTQL